MYKKTTLANGLRLITASMPHTRAVSVCFYIATGSRHETDEQAGISHFIEHMLFKGSAKRPTSRLISEAIEGVGGILNGFTDKEMTCYWAKVPRQHFGRALDVLGDMILNPILNKVELKKERQVITEEISMSNDDPPQRAGMLLDGLLWAGHPLGRDIAGSKETVASISKQIMQSYISDNYIPSRVVVSIAGNIEHEEALKAVEDVTKGWSCARKQQPAFKPYKKRESAATVTEKRDLEQAHLCLALPAFSLYDPRRYTLGLLNTVLGQGMSGRLFTEVRDKLGLAYQIYSHVDNLQDSGALSVYAGVKVSNLGKAISAILGQLRLFKEEDVPQDELNKAKEFSRGRLLLRMEDSRSVAGWFGAQEILVDEILSVDEVLSFLDAVTAADIREVAQELMLPEELKMVIVGPVDEGKSFKEVTAL
jgi:predicted Zn-dependent peptidase